MEGERESVKKEAKIAKNGTSGEIEDKEVKEQGSKLREEAEWGIGRGVEELLNKQRQEIEGRARKELEEASDRQMDAKRRGW